MAESMTAQGLVLAWPWALVLLPLPWLLRYWLSAAPRRMASSRGKEAGASRTSARARPRTEPSLREVR